LEIGSKNWRMYAKNATTVPTLEALMPAEMSTSATHTELTISMAASSEASNLIDRKLASR
jgi:hypothetical protein